MTVTSSAPKRVTITQVAKRAGVAVATVSAILNRRDYCYASDETKQRVRDAARELGYRPNALARGLLGKATATLGLITAGFDTEMASLQLSGFSDAARAAGQLTITACTRNHPQHEDEAIRWMMDRCVDGMVVYPTEYGEHKELRRLAAAGFPVVTLDGAGRVDFMCDDVSVDCYAGDACRPSTSCRSAAGVWAWRCSVSRVSSQTKSCAGWKRVCATLVAKCRSG